MHTRDFISMLFAFALAAAIALAPAGAREAAAVEKDPHGFEPADDMPYIPDLTGLRHQSFKNQYGQPRHLSEGVVLRQSSIKDGKATVPAGGLYYISEVEDEVRPLMRDPFFILGEHSYLLKLKTARRVVRDFPIKKGQKKFLDGDGYRLWFDYATDHYQKPYAQLALISPAGHWPLEFPVSTHFEEMAEITEHDFPEGESEQLWRFYLEDTYAYGASVFKAKEVGFDKVVFDSIEYPVVEEAMFSFSRPWTLELRQEDYRLYKDKRIYAFRRPNGFLVRVTNLTGTEVLGEKLVRPSTPQGYKDAENRQDEFSLTLPDEDMHIEIMVDPDYLANSDFVPTSMEVPYGWNEGTLSLVVYEDLISLKSGEAWPLDDRFKVGLEANALTGKLQRLVIENAEPFTLDNETTSFDGPVKFSHFWNRPAFSVVAKDFDKKKVFTYYLRDRFFQRTDNMVFSGKKGRRNIDFFVGRAPTLMPLLEDTFLTRLADQSLDTVVEPSHFTSYPKVVSDAAFYAPDPTAPFVPSQKGFVRKTTKNRRGERLLSSEGFIIRGSYVDYDNNRIVIPPSGLYYTSRNARNVRALTGETFYFLGKKAYLASFESATVVRKDFDIDFWRLQPTGQMNPIYWQDEALGYNNKMVRFTEHAYLDDRVMGEVNIIKYSGNPFGAPFHLTQGFDPKDKGSRYSVTELFAEGSTWTIPAYVGPNYIRMAEMGTPVLKKFFYTYSKPKQVKLEPGKKAKVGAYTVEMLSIDEENTSVTVALRDKSGAVVATKTLGSVKELWDVLPQHQEAVHKLQLMHDDVMVEIDIDLPTEDGKGVLWVYKDILESEMDRKLEWDSRFTIRPDVCGHCYQLNEILLDNPEPIILDRDNPTFDGPLKEDGTPMFRIVIDSFDGEMIFAWHVETQIKDRVFKTSNLAFNPRNNIDVMVGANGSIEGFLRQSMVERMAYIEYWRRGVHPPLHQGLAAREMLRLQ